jgi:DNA-binding SARP family transcriptional activator
LSLCRTSEGRSPFAAEILAMGATLQIRLFGNFSLTSGDQPVAGMTTPRLQSLLAFLVLHRDAPQPRRRLAFLFWPDTPEAPARNNLRQALYALRAALPKPDAYLSADTNELRWRLDAPFTLDVADFEQAAAEVETTPAHAEGSARRAALERAVGLYTADLLPSCFDDWITPVREELCQCHLRLLEQLITLLEGAGDYAAASGYARRMSQHDPLNEVAYRRLMTLLARTGDRSGALQAYHACATVLQRELGIAPSQETQDAYERLLRAEGAPVETATAEHQGVIAISSPLIGRQSEWETVVAAWRQASAGSPAFALVTGEAGIGKSRLAEELAVWAGQQGATAARARCYAAEGRLSLAPVTDWLRGESVHPHLARLHPVWLTEVARVLPEVATEYPALPHYAPIGEVGQRQRFFEALARAVLAAPQPLLLLIDDLQWCDEDTLEWLHFLLRFDSAARLLVIGTARSEELSPGHPLHALLLHLRHTVAVAEIPLRPLDAAETARLGGRIAHRELDVGAAMRLYRETEGNPLFVVETMRAGLAAMPKREREHEPDGGGPAAPTALPPRVQAVIAGRLAQLSAEARELAALAATIGRAFRLDVLARAATIDDERAMRALDELWRKRIVRELGAATYDFTHDKLREVAYAEIGAPQRHLLHRRIAQALEAIYAGDPDAVSAQIASHYERAGLGDQAIPFYQRAAWVAQQVFAYEDAIGALERALLLLDQWPAGARRDAQELTLLLALSPMYRVARGWTAPELERVIYRMLALCDSVGTDNQRAQALYGLGSLLTVQAKLERVQVVDEQMRAACQRANLAPPPVAGSMLAGARLHLGWIAEANQAFEQILAADDPTETPGWFEAQGWNQAVLTRAWQSHALWLLGYPDQALRRGGEAVRLAGDLKLPFNQALAATYLALLQQLRADPATARTQAEEAHQLTMHYKATYYRAWSSILVRYAEAWERPDDEPRERLRAAIEEFKATGARLRLPYYLGLLARVCRKAERPAEGLAVIDEALAEALATNERCWDAELYRMRGELLAARGAGRAAGDDVESALERAREIAQSQQARALELRVAMSWARLLRWRGQVAEARRQVAEIYGWFPEGHDTPDLRRARSLLARLD